MRLFIFKTPTLSDWTRDGRLSRDNVGIPVPSRKSPSSGPGPGLNATGQSGPGLKSAGQSRYQNPAGQQIPAFRDNNPAQSWDGPDVPGFYGTLIPLCPADRGFNLTHLLFQNNSKITFKFFNFNFLTGFYELSIFVRE